MSTETLVFLVVAVLIIGALPTWPHSNSWGYTPMGILVLVLVVFLVWAISGDRPLFRSTGDLKATVQDAGHDLKAVGRDTADAIRRTVQ